MKEFLKKHFHFLVRIFWNLKIHKFSREFEKKYKRNWMNSKKSISNIGYKILLDGHAIEKGMTSKAPRHFGIEKTNNIMYNLSLYDKNNWKKDFAYNFGLSILNKYNLFYEKNNWINQSEYQKTKEFLKNKEITEDLGGVINIKKDSFINEAMIDYDLFLSSRHSVRSYLNKELSENDVIKAVNMAIKTPTACNRQMCKIYNVSSLETKNIIYRYAHGLTNFDKKYIGIFVITYDVSSLCNEYEMYQGFFNAGLVSMNFVNALHSLGIGSCFLEYLNSSKDEAEMKKILNIPNNEQIAIMLAAGYYEDSIISPKSSRKSIDDIYRNV